MRTLIATVFAALVAGATCVQAQTFPAKPIIMIVPFPAGGGSDILPPAQLTPEALGAHHKAEIEKWWPIIKAAGIKLQ